MDKKEGWRGVRDREWRDAGEEKKKEKGYRMK